MHSDHLLTDCKVLEKGKERNKKQSRFKVKMFTRSRMAVVAKYNVLRWADVVLIF